MKLRYAILISLCFCQASFAQPKSYRYMDESGNIFFANRIEDIPQRYRSQVVAPAATPYMSERDYEKYMKDLQSGRLQKKLEKEKEKKEKLKERELKKKEREEKKKQREKEKEERKAKRSKGKKDKEEDTKTDSKGKPVAAIAVVELYVADNCPDCRQAERLLSRHGIDYVKISVEKSERGKKFYSDVGGGDLPLLQASGKLLKGFNKESYAKMLNFELLPHELK